MVKNRRKNFRGFGAGGGGGGGTAPTASGVGGVRGTFGGGIAEFDVGIAGLDDEVAGVGAVADLAFIEVSTLPGGRGSEVLELADPGSTIGFESA